MFNVFGLNNYLFEFLFLSFVVIFFGRLLVNFVNSNYTNKGLAIGFVITFVFILIPSFDAPIKNYNKAKKSFNNSNLVINNCGTSPSYECLKNLCVDARANPDFCWMILTKVGNNESAFNAEIKVYTSGSIREPDALGYLKPNIRDGLGHFLMFGIIGIILLFLPIIIGYLLGRFFDKKYIQK
jgi:hypothetical protein